MSNKKHDCCIITFFLISVVTGIILFSLLLGFTIVDSYSPYNCDITNVIYPISINNPSVGFGNCDCGRYCVSNLGTRVTLYGSISGQNNSIMIQKHTINTMSNGLDATFSEKKCRDGENINNRIDAMEKAQNLAYHYINISNSNQTIICYSNGKDDVLFLYNDVDMESVIILSVFFGLSMICCIISIFNKYRNNTKK